LSGGSVSAGYNLFNGWGATGSINGTGYLWGPTFGVPGGSVSATYAACGQLY
jgi:hypothetical protein